MVRVSSRLLWSEGLWYASARVDEAHDRLVGLRPADLGEQIAVDVEGFVLPGRESAGVRVGQVKLDEEVSEENEREAFARVKLASVTASMRMAAGTLASSRALSSAIG